MKETIEFIKKLWENKRTRALSILIMYVIFFGFVFAILSSNQTPIIEESKENVLEHFTNYKLEIIGEDNFTYDSITNQVFYDGVYYELNNRPEILNKYDLDFYNPNNILDLLEDAILESTNYVDKSDTYLVNVSDLESNDLVDYVKVIKYENKIIIDLTDYYGYTVNIELRS